MKWTMKTAAPFVVLAWLLALAGCAAQSGGSPDCEDGEFYNSVTESCDEPEPQPEPEPEPEPEDSEPAPEPEPEPEEEVGYYIDPAATCITDGDLEGAFAEGDMYEYLNCVVPGIDAWIDTVYSGMPHPKGYVYVLPGAEVATKCDPGVADDMSAHYCPADSTVYIGHERLWGFYSVLGDASAFVVLAHEVGHHLEQEVGVYDQLSALSGGGQLSPEYTVVAENAADCVAGAFMNSMEDNGLLTGEEDLNDVAATLAAVADAERESRDHGRLDERVDSFFLAFGSQLDQPVYECNQLVPAETPLIAAG